MTGYLLVWYVVWHVLGTAGGTVATDQFSLNQAVFLGPNAFFNCTAYAQRLLNGNQNSSANAFTINTPGCVHYRAP